MKIGLFGGSFDPVHAGHVRIARRAIDELDLDLLVVLPAAVSPFKAEAAPQGGWDRLLLVRAAFNGIAKARVDDRELRRGGVSYAIDTVREISEEYPGAELFFIIGEDSVAGLPKWKDYPELRRRCEFRAYPRTHESSTEVRRLLAAGETGERLRRLLPEPVYLFILHGVTYNADAKVRDVVLDGLRRKEGYCPCRLPKAPEFFCPCGEFRSQLADPAWRGLCHCRLYGRAV